MPKSKQQKQVILDLLADKIGKAKTIVFAGFNALTVKDNEQLRQKLKAEDGEYYVAKKTLLGKSFKIEGLDVRSFPGKVAAIFAYGDEVAPAKALDDFRKDKKDKLFFVGGILEGRVISAEEVDNLAKLPSKQQLYAQLVGSLNAPVSGFVNVLSGNLRSLVYVLKAIEAKK